jgi:hypothetical protein
MRMRPQFEIGAMTTEQRERKRQWQRLNRERRRAKRRRELEELNPWIRDLTLLEDLAERLAPCEELLR